jgi:DNA-binding transcriptional regulator YhcF (GntR family)
LTIKVIALTLFRFELRPGQSIFDQVVFAAEKAFIGEEFQTGQACRSVRAPAADLKVHPNTAHRVIQHLIQERFLEVRPGIGTVVAELPVACAGDRKRLLQGKLWNWRLRLSG